MIKRLLEILNSKDTQEGLQERLRSNPKTAWAAVLVAFFAGGAAALYEAGYLIAAGAAAGLGSLVAIVGLLSATATPPDQGGK